MKPLLGFAPLLLLVLIGCPRNQTPSGNNQDSEKSGPKLKALLASTDRVLIKDFYQPQVFSPAVPPSKTEGPYHITTTWFPGHISFEPVTVTEPSKEQSKEPKKLKGIRVEILSVNYMVSTTKGAEHRHVSFLDDDEARDFDNALSYLASSAAEWANQKPDHEREVTFHSKDQFEATLGIVDGGPAVIVRSGDIGGTLLKIPAAQTSEVQEKLKAALKVLEAH
jgi:hypothetical protein